MQLAGEAPPARFVPAPEPVAAPDSQIGAAAKALNGARTVTMLVGIGARGARAQAEAVAERLAAPMVLTLKAKAGLEADNDFQVGQAGLLGNPAATDALRSCDALLMVGTDFPYRDFYPEDATVVQIDAHGAHVGRRVSVQHAVVGDAAASLDALLPLLKGRRKTKHLDKARTHYLDWREDQREFADPRYRKSGLVARVRSWFDNPDQRIRPEAVAAAADRLAPDDTIFTSDTGMSTVWLARFVEMRGTRELIGSFNLGSMANALPQALGAQALDRRRPVVSFSGDGGLMMLLGDLRTAVTFNLPVVVVVFNNGSLGMVKLEQEQGGLPSSAPSWTIQTWRPSRRRWGWRRGAWRGRPTWPRRSPGALPSRGRRYSMW